MAKSDLAQAIEQLCEEKNIPYEAVIDSIEAALAVAYRKESGNKMLNVRAEFNPDDGASQFFDVKTVTEDPSEEELEAVAAAEAEEQKIREERRVGRDDRRGSRHDEPREGEEEEEKRFNPKTDLGITQAKELKADAEVGDEMITELPLLDDFGRVAAQTAKQVIIQKLREAERQTLYDVYKDRVGEIVNATVHRVEGPMVYMDLGQATAMMPPAQRIRTENYSIGARFKVLLLSVEQGRRGPEIIASRSAAEMVEKLFETEVPEIGGGSIEIKGVAREAGSRTKIAVLSLADNIDPIGSCVGQRGARVQTVMNELGGEKIDIIEYNEEPVNYIVNALSPAKVISVQLDEEERVAKAFVAEDQLSLAIGKGGQNVRLAAKLTGWKIDVVNESGEDNGPVEKTDDSEEVTDEIATEASDETVVEVVDETVTGEELAADSEETPAVEEAASEDTK
ncbi:MAG: transcription termination/antitermination protein NusA [Candidatus Kerfeldbacteria bacterium CG15_BIG_FIL_POST_REV_8_21_14_020_45_12]|uniref:Transcription termination/antitermination protein NusA n=1 Tax=Candidatus Kerfeldbacteria bacterium CG15_BIG_FIL_POST_REV_8_21_14_020_45_12 TaxID=2014247 RepID=A0A2M7H2S3_9BACT|nr:MAG: transcription termination/antitermination protein NusA [Candidatus Kerfeldbacteria bacterium CG15_BIG_FIL_POST_REV_8_21_14_020_45_12]PJA93243.1 MAG: transcription termination/antitermination protein NusA [Candidatus Kerfeldbacteria bacterium CG_4_9_14_3_um_filter_45_8]